MTGSVRSADGTRIAFERTGDGPPVILVGGAFHVGATEAPLATLLAPSFTVITYDRRGRGASGDTLPYVVQREVEDLEALIGEVGGASAVYGVSTGAILALETAARGVAIPKLALFEPPYRAGGSRPARPDFAQRLEELLASASRGEAVEFFLTDGVGVPAEALSHMRTGPMWPAFEALAHTLVYDTAIVGDTSIPAARLAAVTSSTLVMHSTASPAFLRDAAQAVANAVPDAGQCAVDGRFHDAAPETIALVLHEFFLDRHDRGSQPRSLQSIGGL